MSAARPVFLIGLDGATWDLLDPLLSAGDLPTLGALVASGGRATLRSVAPPITPAAWSSFMTGKRPGKHGVYDFRVYDPRSYCDTFVSSRAVRGPTLWELLTQAGRRVAVVNLPMMYPPPPRAGTVVSGFDTPSLSAVFTHPAALKARLLERIPDYFILPVTDPGDPALERDDSFERFVSAVERGIEQRMQVALDLLADGPWDAFMIHFQETDVLQHGTWRYIADRDRYPSRWERVRGAYRRLDRALAELLRAAPPAALVLVLSDHGFGSHTGRLFPNSLLRQWGYLSRRGQLRARLRRWLRKQLAVLGLVERRAARVEAWATRVREEGFGRALPLRWRGTRAYVAMAEIYGLLYLNLRGREPAGTVSLGVEAERLLGELRARLLAVKDPRDGGPLFADVAPGELLYPDDPLGRRPDLVLVPRPGFTVHRDLTHRWIDHYPAVAGTHRLEGVLLAAGDGVRPGVLQDGAELIDLAPTVLVTAGLPIPEDMDGRVLAELFTEPPVIRHAPAAAPVAAEEGALSADETAQVTRRLQALGYLE